MRCSCNVQHRQACECMPIPSFQSSSPGFCGRYPLAHAKQRSARLLVSLHYTIGLHGWTLRHILFSNFLNLHLVSFCSHSSTTQDPQDCARKENGISWASPECQGRRLNTTGGLIPGGSGKIQDGLFLRALDGCSPTMAGVGLCCFALQSRSARGLRRRPRCAGCVLAQEEAQLRAAGSLDLT